MSVSPPLHRIKSSIPAQSECKNTEVSFLTKLPFPPASCDCILSHMLLVWGKLTHKLPKVGDSRDPSAWHLSFKMQKQYKFRQIAQFSYRKGTASTLKGARNLLNIISIHFLQVQQEAGTFVC